MVYDAIHREAQSTAPVAMAHSCRGLAADDTSLLQRLAEDLDLSLLVALPARSRIIPFWGLSSTRGAIRAGLTLLAPVVLVGASIGSLCAASSAVTGSESSLEA